MGSLLSSSLKPLRISEMLEQDRECCGCSAWRRENWSFALSSVYHDEKEEEEDEEREEEEALERVTDVSWSYSISSSSLW